MDEIRLSFFNSLSSLVNLRHLTIKIYSWYARLPQGAARHLSGLEGLKSLRLPDVYLSHDETQWLAGLPLVKRLFVGSIKLTAPLMQRCAWQTLQLGRFPSFQTIPFLPRLPGGLLLPDGPVSTNWGLGSAAAAAAVVAAAHAVALATSNAAASGALAAHRAKGSFGLALRWEELPKASAVESAAPVISALPPWGAYITTLALTYWRVDASVIRAISTHLPRCQRLTFGNCDVSSQAWVKMQGLPPSCKELCISGNTAVVLADLVDFVSTFKRGMRIRFEEARESSEEEEEDAAAAEAYAAAAAVACQRQLADSAEKEEEEASEARRWLRLEEEREEEAAAAQGYAAAGAEEAEKAPEERGKLRKLEEEASEEGGEGGKAAAQLRRTAADAVADAKADVDWEEEAPEEVEEMEEGEEASEEGEAAAAQQELVAASTEAAVPGVEEAVEEAPEGKEEDMEAEEVEAYVDPIRDIRAHIPTMLPALAARRRKAGLPPCNILFDIR